MPLLLAVPLLILAEITLFVTVGGAIGLLPTLAIVLGSGVLGGMVLRGQGQKSLAQMTDAVRGPGRAPGGPLAAAGDGVLVALAGILLILPGFLTDGIGLVLLIPLVRQLLLRRFADYARRHPGAVSMHVVQRPEPSDAARYNPMTDGDIIEGEVLDPPPGNPHADRIHR